MREVHGGRERQISRRQRGVNHASSSINKILIKVNNDGCYLKSQNESLITVSTKAIISSQ